MTTIFTNDQAVDSVTTREYCLAASYMWTHQLTIRRYIGIVNVHFLQLDQLIYVSSSHWQNLMTEGSVNRVVSSKICTVWPICMIPVVQYEVKILPYYIQCFMILAGHAVVIFHGNNEHDNLLTKTIAELKNVRVLLMYTKNSMSVNYSSTKCHWSKKGRIRSHGRKSLYICPQFFILESLWTLSFPNEV